MPANPIEIGPVGLRVAARVVAARESQRITQQQLAERLTALGRPVATSSISKLETGERRTDVDDLAALAEALGMSVAALLAEPTCSNCQDVPPPAGYACLICGNSTAAA